MRTYMKAKRTTKTRKKRFLPAGASNSAEPQHRIDFEDHKFRIFGIDLDLVPVHLTGNLTD